MKNLKVLNIKIKKNDFKYLSPNTYENFKKEMISKEVNIEGNPDSEENNIQDWLCRKNHITIKKRIMVFKVHKKELGSSFIESVTINGERNLHEMMIMQNDFDEK